MSNDYQLVEFMIGLVIWYDWRGSSYSALEGKDNWAMGQKASLRVGL